jgi:mRNA-degrading endonuclease RelE of RelBE toxin-antitoxin system
MIQVQVKESALRDLRQLDPTIAQKVYDKLGQLQRHPEPHKWLRKVEGTAGNLYRLHVGRDWVVIGELEGNIFYVIMVEHRSKVYQNVKRR